jgi:hypothetical protein
MSLTAELCGQRIAAVMSNGNTLALQFHDGSELQVAWVDDNGKPIKGKPVMRSKGFYLRAEGLQDLIPMHGVAA